MRKILALIAVAALAIVGFTASPASAGSVTALTDSKNFALACDLGGTSNARSRIDFTNIEKGVFGNWVDADDIWYRSLATSTNAQSTWRPTFVGVEVHLNGFGWDLWTSRGGSASDGSATTVAPNVHWDPTQKTIVPTGAGYDAVRIVAYSTSGALSCTSPSHSLAVGT